MAHRWVESLKIVQQMMVEQDCDPSRLPTTLENLCKLHILTLTGTHVCVHSHNSMMHTGTHTHTQTHGWAGRTFSSLGGPAQALGP